MCIRNSIYYTAILTLFVTAPLLAAEPFSQIQSLQGRVWVQRGDANIEANSALEIHSGDSISTSETGRIATRLWSQLNFKLDISSKIIVISDTKQSDTPVIEKFIKLEYGAGCIEIDHVMDSPVLFQIGDRVTMSFIKPVELCLSTDDDISHVQLIKGRVELTHLTNSMLIALNEPGSEIKFFNGGIFSLISAASATQPVTPIVDLREFPKPKDLKELAKTEDSNEPPKAGEPKELSKTEDLKESSNTVDLKIAPKIAVPAALSKTEDLKEPAKTEESKALSKTEDLKQSPNTEDLNTPAKITVPIALSNLEDSKEPAKVEAPKESFEVVDVKVPAKQIAAPIALTKTEHANEPTKSKHSKELFNVYLSASRSYETAAAVNRRLRDSGYSSVVIDEIDNKGPLFRVSVPNFETIAAAREFVDKVVASLGIHDAWIERHQIELSTAEVLNESNKKEEPKKISKTEAPKEASKAVDLEVAPQITAPIAVAKTEVSNKPATVEEPKVPAITEAAKESSNTKNSQELFNVYLSASRSYESAAALNRRLRDTGYGSVVIDEIDSQGPLFRVSVPNFETIAAARGFVDKVAVSLGIHNAWIERQQSRK